MLDDAFDTLPILPPTIPVVSGSATAVLKSLKRAGFATKSHLSSYLGLSVRHVEGVLLLHGISANKAGMFIWEDVWAGLWNIQHVPSDHFEKMKAPLLSNAVVASFSGVCERSIRRDGNRKTSRYDLPQHLDLSERIRRHHPLRIHAWLHHLDLEPWLSPVARRPKGPLGMKRRKAHKPDLEGKA